MFRPMRRFKQQLSFDDCESVLKQEKRGVLALSGDNGYPYALPLDFVYENGRIYFHCAKKGHKIDAVKSCDKASFCVYTPGEKPEDDWAYFVKSVIAFGKRKLLTDKTQIEEKGRLLGNKYYPDKEDVEKEIKKDIDRVAVMELSIEHMTGKTVHEK